MTRPPRRRPSSLMSVNNVPRPAGDVLVQVRFGDQDTCPSLPRPSPLPLSLQVTRLRLRLCLILESQVTSRRRRRGASPRRPDGRFTAGRVAQASR